MAEEFNPTQFAIESLITAGAHEQAAQLALKVSKRAAKNQPAADPAAPVEPEVYTRGDGSTVVPQHVLVGMSLRDLHHIKNTDPGLYKRSMDALVAR